MEHDGEDEEGVQEPEAKKAKTAEQLKQAEEEQLRQTAKEKAEYFKVLEDHGQTDQAVKESLWQVSQAQTAAKLQHAAETEQQLAALRASLRQCATKLAEQSRPGPLGGALGVRAGSGKICYALAGRGGIMSTLIWRTGRHGGLSCLCPGAPQTLF